MDLSLVKTSHVHDKSLSEDWTLRCAAVRSLASAREF
jgi:hypothetical protein